MYIFNTLSHVFVHSYIKHLSSKPIQIVEYIKCSWPFRKYFFLYQIIYWIVQHWEQLKPMLKCFFSIIQLAFQAVELKNIFVIRIFRYFQQIWGVSISLSMLLCFGVYILWYTKKSLLTTLTEWSTETDLIFVWSCLEPFYLFYYFLILNMNYS